MDPGALPERVDVVGAILKLIQSPSASSPAELGLACQFVHAATQFAGPSALLVHQTAPGSFLLDDGSASDELTAMEKLSILHVSMTCLRRANDMTVGPGRGYSEWPRAPRRLFVRKDRVSELRTDREKFKNEFTLFPEEFDVLYGRVRANLEELPRRWLDTQNRLAMALNYMRTGTNQAKIAAWFGCGHTSANDDIDDVVNVIFDDPETINEIAWPTQAEGDLIVLQVADYAPNLAGVMVAGDAKKRATNQRGRTFDRDLHKVDYDGNKGHGRQMFLCCTVDTGRMCYLDANYGGRGESYNYHEYDISRQRHRTYWYRTMLPAKPSIGRPMPRYVDWTGVGDAAHAFPVHNAQGAPEWYHPVHNRGNAELNEKSEYCRTVVEHQFGRIGSQWKLASDNAGPWHHVGNGGHRRSGSEHGMAKSVIYYMVCARLTAMTQRMRKTYPRNPAKFFRSRHEDWEIAICLRNIHAARQRHQKRRHASGGEARADVAAAAGAGAGASAAAPGVRAAGVRRGRKHGRQMGLGRRATQMF